MARRAPAKKAPKTTKVPAPIKAPKSWILTSHRKKFPTSGKRSLACLLGAVLAIKMRVSRRKINCRCSKRQTKLAHEPIKRTTMTSDPKLKLRKTASNSSSHPPMSATPSELKRLLLTCRFCSRYRRPNNTPSTKASTPPSPNKPNSTSRWTRQKTTRVRSTWRV